MTGTAIARGLTCTFFNPTLRYHTGWETQMKRRRSPFRTQSLRLASIHRSLSRHNMLPHLQIFYLYTHSLSLYLSLSIRLPLFTCCFVLKKYRDISSPRKFEKR